MKLKRTLLCSAILAASAVYAPAALSATVVVNSVVGEWTDTAPPVPPIEQPAPNHIRWGTPVTAGEYSGYKFDGIAPPATAPVATGTVFDIGTFTHENFPIFEPHLEWAELTVTSSVSVYEDDGTTLINTFNDVVSVFDFFHWETPNGANPCADGGAQGVGVNANGCADRVTFDVNAGATDSFIIDNVEYILDISGFLVGGALADEFWTMEDANNTATMQGVVTERANIIPIPAAAWLFGSALIGLVGVARRRASKA